jgi:hypothetical protein
MPQADPWMRLGTPNRIKRLSLSFGVVATAKCDRIWRSPDAPHPPADQTRTRTYFSAKVTLGSPSENAIKQREAERSGLLSKRSSL